MTEPKVQKKARARLPRRGVGQHHGKLRSALLQLALQRLAEQGDDDDPLSLRALAKQAGVAPAAPYHHFGSRDGLVAALALEGFLGLGELLDAVARDVEEPAARLGAMVHAYVDFALGRLPHYRLMWSPGMGHGQWPDTEEAALACFARLCAAVRAVSRVDEGTAATRAAMVWSLAHGYVELSGDGVLAGLPAELGRAAVVAAALQIASGS